ncbi:hypothetical protein EST38_g10746 [Candolleomyces aberdarensis]|uniref:Uncharacterized protein n=1 Tax=Candolleomyces aberdarensis TaxID=2316362 RepID=A0A4Q2D9H3_9AGAR|nr:hypothetical protein EST38_g10746 [Candolleomyces aberdarensis]
MAGTEERLHRVLVNHVNTNSIDLWLKDQSLQGLNRWFSRIEKVCQACDLLEGHYAEAALLFIESGDLVEEMREKKKQYLDRTLNTYWIWNDFKEEIRRAVQEADKNPPPRQLIPSVTATATPPDHLSPDELRQRLYNWTSRSRIYPLFRGSSQELGRWFLIVERACRESGIPPNQRTEAASMLIFEELDLAAAMQTRRQEYLQRTGEAYWGWQDFQQDIRNVVTEAERRNEGRSNELPIS